MEFQLVSSLEKVFFNQAPKAMARKYLSGLRGEVLSFQVACFGEKKSIDILDCAVSLRLKSPLHSQLRCRVVGSVPSDYPAHPAEERDDNYLRTEPGLFPDVLLPLTVRFGRWEQEEDAALLQLRMPFGQWRTFWFDLELLPEQPAGRYPLEILAADKDGQPLWQTELEIEVIGAQLPKQELIHTEWFHADCLADYYRVPVFSEEHWRIIENFMRTAGRSGVNAILTPVFTLPLDTMVGGERTTHQLVDITWTEAGYEFAFDRLTRWIELASDCGLEYIEFAHLFTQWGAKAAPKIMVWENGELKKRFGWETAATSPEYTAFLRAFLLALKDYLAAKGLKDKAIFHISDEPHNDADKESYLRAKNTVKDLLADCFVTDALSSYDIYIQGVIEHPVVATNRIDYFIENGAKDLWAYYCCSQKDKVSNRFFAMPAARTRILGVQLYKFDIKGFLHWGYNFYNSQFSLEKIDPYRVTDAGEAFPSGDTFLVYPGENGEAVESLRLMVLAQAFYDFRALKYLESLTDKSFVLELIEGELAQKISFADYPAEEEYLWRLRERVNREIGKRVAEGN